MENKKTKTETVSVNLPDTKMGESTIESLRRTKMGLEIESIRQDNKMRKTFSILIFLFVVVYVILVLALVYFISLGWVSCSDTIIVTLLSTTTANIIALFAFVARYLYNTKK